MRAECELAVESKRELETQFGAGLLKLESAVEALVWIFHQQEEEREQTGKRSSDDSDKYRPQRHGSFDYACRVASNASEWWDD